mgnify:CR=1 FL=1
MTINFGTVCPCYSWVKVGTQHCENCPCFEGFSPDNTQTYCNYSQLPNCEPEFKKGDYAYRIEAGITMGDYVTKDKVRNSIWVRNHWEYQFGREQHHFPGYKTEEEALKIVCQDEVKKLNNRLKELKRKMEKCGLSLETVTTKLLEGVK